MQWVEKDPSYDKTDNDFHRIVESENILSRKGPTGIIRSNSWPKTEPSKEKEKRGEEITSLLQ